MRPRCHHSEPVVADTGCDDIGGEPDESIVRRAVAHASLFQPASIVPGAPKSRKPGEADKKIAARCERRNARSRHLCAAYSWPRCSRNSLIEPNRSRLRQGRLDRPVREQRIGHAIDHAGFEHRADGGDFGFGFQRTARGLFNRHGRRCSRRRSRSNPSGAKRPRALRPQRLESRGLRPGRTALRSVPRSAGVPLRVRFAVTCRRASRRRSTSATASSTLDGRGT